MCVMLFLKTTLNPQVQLCLKCSYTPTVKVTQCVLKLRTVSATKLFLLVFVVATAAVAVVIVRQYKRLFIAKTKNTLF